MKQHFESRSWEWIDQNHFVCRERALSRSGDRIVARELISHAEKGVLADQFYAERLYTKEKISELLDKCGYRNLYFHGNLESSSSRGQDLGMMANRMIILEFRYLLQVNLYLSEQKVKIYLLVWD